MKYCLSSNLNKEYLKKADEIRCKNLDEILDLYELRYVQGKKQAEIAKILNLYQSEVSKRLFELMEQVKIALGVQVRFRI